MGIIKAALDSVRGGLADTWLEVIEPDSMSDTTCIVPGVLKSTNAGRGSNKKGSDSIISNGSIIHVYDNQFMMLIDGGKVVDYTAEPGYYKVDNSAMPSLFNGQFGDTLKETFSRIKYGGVPSQSQKVFYLNLQEIKGIPFGTSSPLQYFDSFYNAELFMRVHGTYSIKIVEPFKFYQEVIPRSVITDGESLDFKDVKQQYATEFEEALGTAFNQYSADGQRISFITSKASEMGKYLSDALDEEWTQLRGFKIVKAAVAPPSYDDKSKELIEMRNKGAMLSDNNIQKGYVAANISEGLKDAGSNGNGSMAGFMGMGVGMNMGGNILGGYQNTPQQPQQPQPQQPQQPQQAQQAAPAGGWVCSCGAANTGKFCSECGTKKPDAPKKKFCSNCGNELNEGAKFCPECGNKIG